VAENGTETQILIDAAVRPILEIDAGFVGGTIAKARRE